jgi:nuclear pore complex protein Nup98-Nup96
MRLGKQSIENESAIRLLKLQLDHTPIYADSGSDIPFAVTHPELRFLHFVNLFSSLDQSPEADLWRLGQALFDEIEDLMLPDDATSEMVNHITEIRRRDRVETWLEEVIKGDVEENLREVASKATTDSSARRIFTLLSGHQIERACEAAVDLRDLRLATLLAQAGGDDEFREDIYLQLAKWREYRVDAHIAVAYRRVYELLCGNVGLSEGVAPGDKVDAAEEFHVGDKLDWKRTFGLNLWYGTFHSPLATSVKRYQSSVVEDSRVSPPVPSYIETRIKGLDAETMWKNDFEPPTDPLFEFLKLYSNPTHSLEETLWPRNFGPSPLDYRLPWHLYILFSRVLRKRDFEDRVEVGDEEENGVKGNSVRADLLTISYATQLELAGTWEWAAFVLLHLELPEGRAQAIRDLLARNVEFLDEEHFSFLTITLKIPPRWIYSAQVCPFPRAYCKILFQRKLMLFSVVQAIRAKYNGDVFAEYKMLLAADEQGAAHNIVVTELAPEAIIRSDMGLLRRLLDPFNPREVAEWESGGKVRCRYSIERELHTNTTRHFFYCLADLFGIRRLSR